jgi:hypothetical protein
MPKILLCLKEKGLKEGEEEKKELCVEKKELCIEKSSEGVAKKVCGKCGENKIIALEFWIPNGRPLKRCKKCMNEESRLHKKKTSGISVEKNIHFKFGHMNNLRKRGNDFRE